MPPTLRLSQFTASRGSQVEEPDRLPVRAPPAQRSHPPVLILRNVRPSAKNPDAFTYSSSTTAVVSETPDFVEVSDGPPGSGLTMGERRAHDGTWTEKFVHQRGAGGGAGTGKGAPKGKGKGKGGGDGGGAPPGPRDFGRRMGQNKALSQRWKETWERVEDPDATGVRTKVERHVQEVDDLEAEDEAVVKQEWDEDEEGFEAVERGSTAASSSSSSAPTTAAGNGSVLVSRTWKQRGKDKATGRVWSRTITKKKVRVQQEVLSESEEETNEVEADGTERGSTRHRLGRSVTTKEWGTEASGNRWRSNYSLQTLVNAQGDVCAREAVSKWYDNGQEEQTEEWETLDEFEEVADPGASKRLRLKRRIRSGRKDGRKHHGQCTEWHERWEEQEEPDAGVLKVRRKKLEKWWKENSCNNAWGEHRVEALDASGGSEWVEQRKWYDNGHERQDEQWTERADGSAEGTKEGARDGHTWGERWRRKCEGDDGDLTVEKWHDDGLGTKTKSNENKRWEASKDVEWHREELGEIVGQSATWTVKTGGNERGDEWFESWAERQAEKSAQKSGKNAHGDTWRETWTEEYSPEGVRVRQQAEKEGSNARGDQWYETWIEDQEKAKRALKRGQNAEGAQWQEEWGEQVGDDGSGSKWTSKWADDGHGNKWGNNWGDEWGAGGHGGKRWVEDWDNKGKMEKHAHDTEGRPKH